MAGEAHQEVDGPGSGLYVAVALLKVEETVLERPEAYRTDSAGTKCRRGGIAQGRDQSLRAGQLFHGDEIPAAVHRASKRTN